MSRSTFELTFANASTTRMSPVVETGTPRLTASCRSSFVSRRESAPSWSSSCELDLGLGVIEWRVLNSAAM
eukprot:4458758-Prymnesium_polylepis.1